MILKKNYMSLIMIIMKIILSNLIRKAEIYIFILIKKEIIFNKILNNDRVFEKNLHLIDFTNYVII